MSLISRAKALFTKAVVQDCDHGGWIDTSAPWNFWQTGHSVSGQKNEVATTCVQAYWRTIAQLPGKHIRKAADGHDEEVTGSPLQRVMHKPNHYQTRSDLLLNLVSSLLYEGNAYVLAVRNKRFEIESIHLMPPHACSPHVHEGEIFYYVSPDPVSGINAAMMVPARDVAHVRLYTPHDPLRGETPIAAASMSVSVNNSITGHQASFFKNMSRPSGLLQTEEKLSKEQSEQLRKRWDDYANGLNVGKVPILGWGIKWQPMSLNSVDAQLIESQKMSVERIAGIYGVPLPLIGVLDSATYNNVYNLMSFWKANGLGFVLEHIEQAFGVLFGLKYGERLELDTNKLLRTDLTARYDALTKGITGGLLSPNEARLKEGLPPKEGGDSPRVQQQMVPLNFEPEQQEPPENLQLSFDSDSFIADVEQAANAIQTI